MENIRVKTNFTQGFIEENEIQAYQQQLFNIQKDILDKNTPEMIFWVGLICLQNLHKITLVN